MSSYYAADHIAEEHMHTDISCTFEEPQEKYRLGTARDRLLEEVA